MYTNSVLPLIQTTTINLLTLCLGPIRCEMFCVECFSRVIRLWDHAETRTTLPPSWCFPDRGQEMQPGAKPCFGVSWNAHSNQFVRVQPRQTTSGRLVLCNRSTHFSGLKQNFTGHQNNGRSDVSRPGGHLNAATPQLSDTQTVKVVFNISYGNTVIFRTSMSSWFLARAQCICLKLRDYCQEFWIVLVWNSSDSRNAHLISLHCNNQMCHIVSHTCVISTESLYKSLGITRQMFDLMLKKVFIKPARSAGFSRIKKIPYQAPPTQLGPQKCTFWKHAFLGPKYQC